MRKLTLLLLLFASLFVFANNAFPQVTTNEGSGLAAAYSTLAEAITALNAVGTASSPVVITLTGNETTPAGGYRITATGSAANTITIQGSSSTITAYTPQVSGRLYDAIFKIIGGDYITIQNFTMQENAGNTTTTANINNMTEWGVALLYASTTNGAQNCTIQNNTISLNRTYQNTFGIYSNCTHSETVVGTSTTTGSLAGNNSGLKVYGNNISNVNNGIVVVGPTTAAYMNTGIDIGGTGSGQANTITNYGTTGALSNYANVSGTINGILVRNSNGFNVSYNTITSSVGGVTSGILNGIQVPAASATPTGTFTNNINNNSISLKSGLNTGAMNGINYPSGSASATSTLNINNNDFNNFGHTVAASGAITFILNASTHQFCTINSNTFTNITVNTTGSVTFISNTYTAPANGTKTVNGNSIVTGFNKTGAGGIVSLHVDDGASTTGTSVQNNNNNFSNITVTGSTSVAGWYNTDGTGFSTPQKTITGNTFENWSCGTSPVVVLNLNKGNIVTVTENKINNISGQCPIYGLQVGTLGTYSVGAVIEYNTITNLLSTGAGGNITGISFASSAPTAGTHSLSNNTINTLSSSRTSGVVSGISSSGSGVNISNHTIYGLTCAESATGVTTGITNGIIIQTGNNVNIFKNRIYNLQTSGAFTSAVGVYGIACSGFSSIVNVYNNMVSELKAPAANSSDAIRGISISGSSSGNYNIYNNTVYINANSTGTDFGSTGIYHTYNATSTTAALDMRNNIIVNNSTPNGTGLTVAFRRSAATDLNNFASASNNNCFYAGTPGASNLIFHDGTNSDQTISTYKSRVTPRDALSFVELPPFVNVSAAPYNLHIKTDVATGVESGGFRITTPVAITTDYDGDIRQGETGYTGTGTAPDIGADEFNGIPKDVLPPQITYTVLGNTAGTGNRTLTATITDATGVPTSGTLQPRLWFRKSSGTWVSSQGTLQSGSGTNGVWNFTIDYSVIPITPAAGETYQYYVVAQDIVSQPNIETNPLGGVHTDVNTQTSAPAAPNSYNIITGFSGVYNVGTSQIYTSLTGENGFFYAINNGLVTGNITLNITSDLTEDGTYGLNQWNEEGGTSTYSLNIQPGSASAKIISGNYAGNLIRFNGCDRVAVDGRFSGSGKCLTFRNSDNSFATIALQNDASNNTIRDCYIEGATKSASNGIVFFSTGTTTGNDNNTISNCIIRDRSDAAGIPANLIYSEGTSGEIANNGNAVTNNELFNFTNAAVNVTATGNGDSWNVSYNSIYQTVTSSTPLYGIVISSGNSHNIFNNYIGGTAANAGGSYLSTSGTFQGIYLAVGTASATSVQGNVVRNIRSTLTGAFDASYGIYLNGGMANIGNVTGNTVGDADANYRFEINGDSYGIRVKSTSAVNLSNNIVRNFKTNLTPRTGEYYTGIAVEGIGGTHSIINNTVADVANASAPDAVYNTLTYGMYISATGVQTVRGNTIYNIGSTNTTASSSNNNIVRGLIISRTSAGTVVEKNKIHNIYGSGTGTGYAADIIVCLQSEDFANASYNNNQISTSGGESSDRYIYGILDLSESPAVCNYYYNSVCISGTSTGSNNTYSFSRNLSETVTLRNNLFCNARIPGAGYNYAVGNIASTPAAGWSGSASNYNLFIAPDAAKIGEWGSGTGKTFSEWKASSLGDANSWSETSGIISIANLFTDFATGDLNIKTDRIEAWYVKGKGVQISGLSDDFGSTGVRSTTVAGGSTSIGSDEFIPSLSPQIVTASGSPAPGSTTTYTQAGRTLGSITWGASGTVPSSVSFRYFSGTNPLGSLTGNYSNGYWEITVPDGSDFTYDLTLNYDPAMIGTIGAESDIRIAKREGSNPWVFNSGSSVDVPGKTVTLTGLSSFSQFTLSDINSPLPVQLESFTSAIVGRNVKLNWITSTENNNAGFEIEKAVVNNGNPVYLKIGYVNGNGTTTAQHSYIFEDNKLNSGKYIYRLKQIDFNGNYEYHNLNGEVEIGIPAKFELSQNYPNPFNPSTKIDFALPADSKVSLMVYDISGREVKRIINNDFTKAGYHTVQFNAENLSSGVYFYRIVAGNNVMSKKMLLIK